MKITQWLGFNEQSSQYLLRSGELRALVNLQPRRLGMLITRPGLSKLYGKYDDESIIGIYRRDAVFGNPGDYLWFQKALVPRQLTAQQIAEQLDPFEYVWIVRRIEGYQSRVIDQIPISPLGTTSVKNFCVAEDRHGRMFIFYGHGASPKIYRPSDLANTALDMGMAAPTIAPIITPSGSGYFLDSVQVISGGGAYYAPPTISLDGGEPERPATLRGIVQQGNLVGVEIVDGGANYKSFPKLTVAADKVGSGFRAVGNYTAAPAVTGFVDTTPGVVTGTAPTSTQTFGSTNDITDNKIMYLASPITATTKVTAQAAAVMTVESLAGISVGDVVRVSPPQGSPFSSATSTVTVQSINPSTKQVTLSQSWTPVQAASVYTAQFRKAPGIGYADATYDTTTKRFTASFPLRTVTGSGAGAEATLSFTPVAYSFGLGTPAVDGYTNPIGGPEQAKFAFKDVGRQNYLYDEFWAGSDFNVVNSKENSTYAGLQASGSSYTLGFSGTSYGRRTDIYWPDYSKLSVWSCSGTLSSDISQWTRSDAQVYTDDGYYILATLYPAAKSRVVVKTGRRSFATTTTNYTTAPGVEYPVVRINLRACPDSWLTSEINGGAFSLPFDIKESKANRLAWWHPGSGTARPIVDLQGSATALDWNTVQVVNPGKGWEKGTVFALRIYQANAYDQRKDFNTAVRELNIPGAHAFFSATTRYSEFVFQATAADTLTPDGPPNAIDGTPYVDVTGSGYATGDQAALTLFRRDVTQPVSSALTSQTITWTAEQIAAAPSGNSISSVRIVNAGRNYFAPPTIEVRGGGQGYGLAVVPTLTNGKITSVTITDPGKNYTESPELYTASAAAVAVPSMRPTMVGRYRCAYRFADRSETVVGRFSTTVGDANTLLTVASSTGIKPDMVVEGTGIPLNTKVKSVNGTTLELSQPVSGASSGTAVSIVVRDMSKPVAYSDFSPIVDIDAGPNDQRTHCSKMAWSIPGITPPARADMVELWRTSADQSLVFYRVDVYGIPSSNGVTIVGDDTLTDEELFDPGRTNYAAMPVVLPNGSVNAYRFGVPRNDMSVCVAFQDRLWYGVSTSGKDANTLFYSVFDEFESFPDVHELPIQNNTKSTDTLTAMIPFGSMLLAMQHRHCYAVNYQTGPDVDPAIQLIANRGCLQQRCWDVYQNVLYAADESGIYAMDRTGEVAPISTAIREFFVSETIDFSKRESFFLQVDPRTGILRFFCTLASSSCDTPDFAMCVDIASKAWWTERWPNSITSSCIGRPSRTRVNTLILGGVDGNLYECTESSDHCNQSVTDCFVGQGGSGYTQAPKITCPSSKGVILRGVVSEGRLVDVLIHGSGWDAKWGIQLLAENGKELTGHDAKKIKGVEYAPIELDVEAPPDGGTQAVAFANFSVTPRVYKYVTIGQGESFVRLLTSRTIGFEPETTSLITTEDSDNVTAQAQPPSLYLTLEGRPLRAESPPVEVGMECIGSFVPLNAFVSRIDGDDVYLEHPDGTPVSMLFGDPHVGEEGGTESTVIFRKPFKAHIPFRLATGALQLANEDNVRKGGDSLIDRSITLVYTPTETEKTVELIEYYNDSTTPRPNVMRRGRGGPQDWVHRQDSASTALNISKNASRLGYATGVAKARFANRANTDAVAEDQHIQVELYARPDPANTWQRVNFFRRELNAQTPQTFVMHSLTIDGVVQNVE